MLHEQLRQGGPNRVFDGRRARQIEPTVSIYSLLAERRLATAGRDMIPLIDLRQKMALRYSATSMCMTYSTSLQGVSKLAKTS